MALKGDGTNNLGAADSEPPTLRDETEVSQREHASTIVQVPRDAEDGSLPEADDHESGDADDHEGGDADEGRAARRKRLATREQVDIKEVIVRELQKKRAKEEHRYHARKGLGRAGRMKGKARQDTRVKKSDWEI